MTRQMPAIDELNGMSGLGLFFTLSHLPKDERNAILNRLDDATIRRYVHASYKALAQYIAWRVSQFLLGFALVVAALGAIYFGTKGLKSLLLAAIG